MINFVNMEQLLNESGLLAQEHAHMEQVKSSLEAGLKQAEEQYKVMKPEQAEEARANDAQVLNEQWQNEQVVARNVVLKVIEEKSIALLQDKKLSAILPVQSAFVIDESVDITAELAARLKSEKLNFSALPQITIKSDEPVDTRVKNADNNKFK